MSDNRVPVLMYHRVAVPGNAWERRMSVTPSLFRQQMLALRQHGYRAISAADFMAWRDGTKQLSDKQFLLTFDDGYLDVYLHAGPVLKELGWPAVMFLVSGLIGQHDRWCLHENPEGASHPLMNPQQISELESQGFAFFSHSRTHADLPTLSDAELNDELAGSKMDLESLLGKPVPYLAYPFGRHDERVVAAARQAGYVAAFSVLSGFNRPGDDLFRIRRIDVFGWDSPARLLRKIRLGSNDGGLVELGRYYWNQIKNRF